MHFLYLLTMVTGLGSLGTVMAVPGLSPMFCPMIIANGLGSR